MKKKKVLKKWVEYTLVFILVMSILVLSFDANSLHYFVLSKVLGLVMVVAITYVLSKYTNFFEE